MKKIKIKINPIKKEITYEIEVELDDISKIDEKDIKQIEEHFSKLKKKINFIKNESLEIVKSTKEASTSQKIELHVPDNLIEKIESIENEEKKIPILWSFSTKEKMSVSEFLELCSKNGFSLSTTWLPSEGGRFSTKIVKNEKFFHNVDKKGSEKYWELTKVGKLKIRKMIQILDKK